MDRATGIAPAGSLRSAPAPSIRGHPERKGKIATPGLREHYSGVIDMDAAQRRFARDGSLALAGYQR
ncbi:hypothetical protein ACWIG5_10970 [Streptomyces lydicus]